MEFCQKATLIFKKLAKSPFFTLKQVAKNFTHFKKFVFWGRLSSQVCLLATLVATVATIWKNKFH
jgi:hypothetical protein